MYTIFCLFTHQSVDTWVTYTFCYCEQCCMNMGVQISLCNPAFNFGGIYPKEELLDPIVILFLIFLRFAILFSTVALSIYPVTRTIFFFLRNLLLKKKICSRKVRKGGNTWAFFFCTLSSLHRVTLTLQTRTVLTEGCQSGCLWVSRWRETGTGQCTCSLISLP